jgi:hypothetical protein
MSGESEESCRGVHLSSGAVIYKIGAHLLLMGALSDFKGEDLELHLSISATSELFIEMNDCGRTITPHLKLYRRLY